MFYSIYHILHNLARPDHHLFIPLIQNYLNNKNSFALKEYKNELERFCFSEEQLYADEVMKF